MNGFDMNNNLKVLVILIFFLFLSCSKENPIEPNSDILYSEMLDNASFNPTSGAPGTIIEISNLELPVGEDTVWSLEIGGNIVPLIRDSGTTIRTVIPLIFEDSNSIWHTPPNTPVNVTLLRFDKEVDSLLGIITIDSLPHAKGAADSLIADLQSGATAIRNIALSIGITDTIMLATYDAMDVILYTGENSLTNILNGNSPLVPSDSMHKEIFSALLVSSGYSDYFSQWSDSLKSIATTAKSLQIQKSLSAITDEELAARMQLQALLEDFGAMVIGNTALSWSEIAVYVGAAGVVIPQINFIEFIVSYIVAELDFIFNKLVIAAFPAEITRMELDFVKPTINVGDTTNAIVYISAQNNPPNITPMDIVLQVVGGMALADWIRNIGGSRSIISQLRNFEQIIQNVTVWLLGTINNFLSANYNYPTQLDINFPHMTWNSVRVNNPELVDLMIPDLSKMSYISGSFNGRAKDSLGKIGLQMRTQPPGPNTWIHPVMQSLGYAGGPFGNDLYVSNIDTVTIVSKLALQVDFANTISANGSNVLGLDAGYFDSDGNPHWEPNIDITLIVTDGNADVTNGVTDAQGHFSSIITIDSTADSVTVEVLAEGQFNSQVDTIVVSFKENDPIVYARLTYASNYCSYVQPNETIPLDITVFNPDSGQIPNAQINVWIDGGGSLGATSGLTDANGDWSTFFTTPSDMSNPINIHVEVDAGIGSIQEKVVHVNRLGGAPGTGPIFIWGQQYSLRVMTCAVNAYGGPNDDGGSTISNIFATCDSGITSSNALSLSASFGCQFGSGSVSTTMDLTGANNQHTIFWTAIGGASGFGEYASSGMDASLSGAILYRKPSGLTFPVGAILRVTVSWNDICNWRIENTNSNNIPGGQQTFDIVLPEGQESLIIPIGFNAYGQGTSGRNSYTSRMGVAITTTMECINCGD